MEDDPLKKIIQKAVLNEPGDSFTDNIMGIIQFNEQAALSATLQSQLKNNLVAEPSVQFSEKIMSRLQQKIERPLIYEPIISRKTWLSIAGIITLVLMYVLVTIRTGAQALHPKSSFADLNPVFTFFSNFPLRDYSLQISILASICILMLWDYYFRRRRSKTMRSTFVNGGG